jgi:hypothetical protein
MESFVRRSDRFLCFHYPITFQILRSLVLQVYGIMKRTGKTKVWIKTSTDEQQTPTEKTVPVSLQETYVLQTTTSPMCKQRKTQSDSSKR